MQRSIMNIRRSDKVRKEEIRKVTKVKDIGYIVKNAKMGLVGHMIRSKWDKWSRRYINGHRVEIGGKGVNQGLDGRTKLEASWAYYDQAVPKIETFGNK